MERVGRTVALLERRGYALPPRQLGELCVGGPLSEDDVVAAVMPGGELELRGGLVLSRCLVPRWDAIASRAACHRVQAPAYEAATRRFVRLFTALSPYVLSVSLAGSLASGGFRESDDVDLNLVVEDGRRHLAYVALNLLGALHAFGRRGKPVDDLTRRPLAPRVMTANLVLERSQCFPLARQDEDMAFELLQSRPLYGARFLAAVVDANPRLLEHFPQLRERPAPPDPPRRLPVGLFPSLLDRPARALGKAAWRYMQWTRRDRPEALARVAFVRSTMRPYALFED